jgi:AcrR family transcriptional regulator
MPRASNREAIVRAALSCFAAQGYESTRVADIARHAGVSAAAIYVHYPSVQALAEEIYLEHFTGYAADLAAIAGQRVAAEERLRQVVRATLRRYRHDPAAFTFVSLRLASFLRHPPEGVPYPLRSVELIISEGQQAGTIRGGDPALLAALFLGALLRPMLLAEFADQRRFQLDVQHDAVIEDACLALLRHDQENPS